MIVNHYTKTTMANTITMEINILRKEMNDLIIESNELAKQGIDLQYKIDNCGNYFDEKPGRIVTWFILRNQHKRNVECVKEYEQLIMQKNEELKCT
jgi:hypothetical protein